MLPPLSAAALFSENLVGVVLRNVFGFAPILWSFGSQTPAPGNGECRRLKFCDPILQPKSRDVARGVNAREFHLFPRLTMNRALGHDWNAVRLSASEHAALWACFRHPARR